MPIVQYQHRPPRVGLGWPELGRLYKGAPRTDPNQKQPPADLDYFRFEPNRIPTASEATIQSIWRKLYGAEPKILRNVQFAVNNLELVFDSWREEWGKSSKGAPLLNRRCDGRTIIFERTREKGEDGKARDVVYREPAPCPGHCQCKPVGRLKLFLPELCAALGVLGTVTLITHAGTDIDNIANSLNTALEGAGRLRGVAFVLYRESVQLMTPGGLPITKSVVRLELDNASAQKVALEAARSTFALSDGQTPAHPQLPPPVASVARNTREDSDIPDLFDENGDDLPDEFGDEGQPVEKLLGDAVAVIVKVGKQRTYHLRLKNNATIGPIYGFDPIRKLSDEWSAQTDLWKEYDAGEHAIPALRVFGSSDGFRFEEARKGA